VIEFVRGLMLAMVLCGAAVGQAGQSLGFQRAEHLRRGVNLSGWFAQTHDFSAQRMDSYTTPADFALIKSLGFDHVRLSIDPEPLVNDPQLGSLRLEPMARLDKTVHQITAAGLNVVLDIHAEENWIANLTHGDDGAERFYAFWGTFAGHFAATDPEKVFFEIMNEPTLQDLYRWQGIQARAVARIRAVAPRHTVIATASFYSGIDNLLALEPVRDENVIYTFHDYNPMWFTHQGATWGSEGWAFLRGVPYPSTPENIQSVLGQEPDERERFWLQRYGWERWDAAHVGFEVAAAAEWAQRRGVPLYCGEFGVYKQYADPKMRATWISDMRTALESKRIGWAMWDYQGGFGLVTKGSGGTVVDQAVVTALGLKK
jgi:aryl-phospho-beta-D-glucosidase BglC (GH1 family)